MALVVVATLARVHNKAEEVALNHGIYITLAATDNLDVVALKFVLCALTHISCEHNLYAHLLHNSGYIRLTTATLWGVEARGRDNLLILDLEDSVVGTMTEVVVYMPIACRYCNLHISNQ